MGRYGIAHHSPENARRRYYHVGAKALGREGGDFTPCARYVWLPRAGSNKNTPAEDRQRDRDGGIWSMGSSKTQGRTNRGKEKGPKSTAVFRLYTYTTQIGCLSSRASATTCTCRGSQRWRRYYRGRSPPFSSPQTQGERGRLSRCAMLQVCGYVTTSLPNAQFSHYYIVLFVLISLVIWYTVRFLVVFRYLAVFVLLMITR